MLRIDVEKRREWLRALRRFKYGIRVRAKLGVLQIYCDKVAAARRSSSRWELPHWESDAWITLLYTSIKNNEFPEELLIGFVSTAEVTFYSRGRQPEVPYVIMAVDEVCKKLSRSLRYKFGVIVVEK